MGKFDSKASLYFDVAVKKKEIKEKKHVKEKRAPGQKKNK